MTIERTVAMGYGNEAPVALPGGWVVQPAMGHNPCYLLTPDGQRCQIMETHTAEAVVRMARELQAQFQPLVVIEQGRISIEETMRLMAAPGQVKVLPASEADTNES